MDREREICGLSLRHQRRILLLLPSVIVKKGEKNTEKHQNERRSLLRCFIRFEEIEFPSLFFHSFFLSKYPSINCESQGRDDSIPD